MPRAFADITFTPSVKAAQTLYGSREANTGFELAEDKRQTLTEPEMAFIAERDSFYMATISENDWPYVQHRGGAAGFIKVIDERTIGFADFKGNRQYISVGNINAMSRVSLILMDYPSRRRLKLWGTAQIVHEAEAPQLIAMLENPSYRARIERAIVIRIEAIEWNCPQHITPRFTENEIEQLIAPVLAENRQLKQQQTQTQTQTQYQQLGTGSLPLRITGIRQLTADIRLYRLEHADAAFLPLVMPGSHLKVPFMADSNRIETRNYSICNVDSTQHFYEIAVLRQPTGRGGSMAIHQQYALGAVLHCEAPQNHFSVHRDERPAVLIAGGIGITPLLPMLQWFHDKQREVQLHYAGKQRESMAFVRELTLQFGKQTRFYPSASGQRLDIASLFKNAPPGAEFYVCGPQGLMDAVKAQAELLGIAQERIHSERFSASANENDKAVLVHLRRSQQQIYVTPQQSILEAVVAAGIKADSDCCVGECGRCAVKVVSGEPEHRDQVLSEADKKAGLMCICVSRAQTNELTLDL